LEQQQHQQQVNQQQFEQPKQHTHAQARLLRCSPYHGRRCSLPIPLKETGKNHFSNPILASFVFSSIPFKAGSSPFQELNSIQQPVKDVPSFASMMFVDQPFSPSPIVFFNQQKATIPPPTDTKENHKSQPNYNLTPFTYRLEVKHNNKNNFSPLVISNICDTATTKTKQSPFVFHHSPDFFSDDDALIRCYPKSTSFNKMSIRNIVE